MRRPVPRTRPAVLFHSLDYLFFLPLVVLLYWGLPRRWRLGVLGAASLFFYGSWNPIYLLVMLLVVVVGWAGGQWLWHWRRWRGEAVVRTVALVLLLTPLFFFKYFDWVAESLEIALAWAGLELGIPRVELTLPIGISFFTFQALAYVIDVGRLARKGDPDAAETNLLRFATFQSFFPQLVAGPIVRRHELLPQLKRLPLLQGHMVGAGVYRICRGMVKKVLFADVLRVAMVDPVFASPDNFTGIEQLFALYAYTLQIYCDFSGYTDIAIGSARLFGIELPENFRRPYQATSVAGFWRRWHITLSNWVRDYIYYPLGGSRVDGGEWKVYRNILATMLIIGMWHGASWNFVVYGLLHGTAVGINRWQRKRTGRRPGDPMPGTGLAKAWAWTWRFLLTFHFVVLARILFRADDLGHAWQLVEGLTDTSLLMPRFAPLAWAVFATGWALHFSPEAWRDRSESWFKQQNPLIWAGVAAAIGALAMTAGSGDSLAFVYYQF